MTSVALHGGFLVSGGTDDTVRLWWLETGEQLRIFEGHEDEVTSVALSPDGCLVLSGSQDETLRVWSLVSGNPVRVIQQRGEVTSVAV